MEEIKYGEDFISISDKEGEIAYWNIQEWEENSQIVFSICNAIGLAKENKLRTTLKKSEYDRDFILNKPRDKKEGE